MPIPDRPIQEPRLTARERIYQTLCSWIIDGTLQPEEKISDVEIAQYFSVSRTPVREAIQLLADQHLIDIYPGKESRIAPIHFDQVRQYYEMMAEIHALAVQFAYPHMDEDVFRTLHTMNEELDLEAHPDPSDITKWDTNFHSVFFTLAGNDFLKQFSDTLYIHIQRVEPLYYKKFAGEFTSQQEHRLIIQALQDRDLDKAKQAMRENWLSSLKAIE